MWRETTKHERNLRIWREELESFVPEKILDFHVHILNAGVMPPGETFSCAGHPIAGYDLDDLAADLAELYPGRETRAVCFGLPDPRYDAGRNNAYLAERCRGARFFALRLFDPVGDTPAALEADLRSGAFLGIKPYPDYVRKADINAVEIPEMLPDWAMEIVDAYGALVMLHIPRKARLADPLNQRQIVELAASRRRARIVLAHIGRAYYLKCVLGNLGAIAPLPNVYVDLAMLNNSEVLEYAFGVLDPSRILFGTDAPLALAPGKAVEINDQYTYVTPVPWKLSISDERRKLVFTSFAYEELRAIRKAVERRGLGRDFLRGLFYENGLRLIESVAAR
ncbi:MAG TPA: amidohydrolase family protein [Planctomycetota bacterium]|jgi:predicted TIM-barrel fold metal-dependent hydrolase|nr:amidohydrolase family protein [Planctomycetota bacterium]OQC20424.1 MAG: Amidohydrolase [Planctomycetes bacterium ADurb.Bin069]NMD34394.1 amidohydrolase family protein [Planctomycetota bacterium]HNS00669.1 amidohydrolase family protein [Planctomycetota bacterium]HNU26778.1 amidohydrolase family protein [Planctomycetota bacterium]